MATDKFIVCQRKPDVMQTEVDALHVNDIRHLLFQGWKSFATVVDTEGQEQLITSGNHGLAQ